MRGAGTNTLHVLFGCTQTNVQSDREKKSKPGKENRRFRTRSLNAELKPQFMSQGFKDWPPQFRGDGIRACGRANPIAATTA